MMNNSHESITIKSDVIFIIPGGNYQLQLIEKTKKRGFLVACADKNPDCPGAKVADFFFAVGIDQRKTLLDLVTSIKPKAIITDQTDAAVDVVAWLSSKLGLSSIGLLCSELFTQKHIMREFSAYHDFVTPDFKFCISINDALLAAEYIGYPVIIKPVNNQSSKGVHRVDNINELKYVFYDSLQFSNKHGVLIEKFLDGIEFTVEGIMTKEGHKTLAISEKKHFKDAPMVACSLEYSPSHDLFDYDLLRNINDRWVNASNLPFGMTHAEYKFTNGTYQLIEIAARGGGNRISSDIVPWVSGIDYQGLLIDSSLGKLPNLQYVNAPNRYALLEFFGYTFGKVVSIKGVDEAKSIKGVQDVVMNVSVGDVLTPPSNDTSRAGYFIIHSENKTELLNLRRIILNKVYLGVL